METRNRSGDLVGRPDQALELLGRPGTQAARNQLNLNVVSPRKGISEACLDVKLHCRNVCALLDTGCEHTVYLVDGCCRTQYWNQLN